MLSFKEGTLILNLNHIRYFVDAVKLGSLDKAAKKHRISQSAVSQAIVSLERILDIPLLSHERRIVRVTDEGMALAPLFEELLAKAAVVHEAAAELKTGYGGSLRLGCTNSLAIGFLPTVLKRYQHQAPSVKVSVSVGNSEVLTKALLQDEIDLALFVKDALNNEALTATLLRQGTYLLVKHKKEKRSVATAGLYVTRRHRPEVMGIRKGLAAGHSPPPIALEIISWEAIKSLIALGSGYGILPDYLLDGEAAKRGLETVALDFKPPTYELVAVIRTLRTVRRNVALMLQHLQTIG